ncbi:hypothetical protein QJS04_geneDACA008642 [Acorus gramineus]|uniref:Plastid lipid-associated protein/fibrillin conserved domain-containing protein n=1 Tax=Acorus gramineus TaxID=55184 RepID=A0AAV9AGF7_ACOGR|nr:hypothetical protein QJS04_geneDACA008642 [Acorus gramineus]
MANLLLKPSIPPRLLCPVTGTGDIPTTQLRRSTVTPIRDHPIRVKANSGIKVSDQKRSLVGGGEVHKSVGETKEALYEALQGIDRGIFGVPSSKKLEIEGLVRLLESENPTPEPTEDLQKVGGWWKLIYSTISIMGSKRTKLGLRDFLSLGDFLQAIDVAQGKAFNVIKFSARGLKMLTGQLTIEASFSIASKTRVDIKYDNSTIAPDQLMNIFQKNYDVLLAIFNPEGWLEITYVDESIRVGRDDKGNIFILERTQEENI